MIKHKILQISSQMNCLLPSLVEYRILSYLILSYLSQQLFFACPRVSIPIFHFFFLVDDVRPREGPLYKNVYSFQHDIHTHAPYFAPFFLSPLLHVF